MLNFRSPSVPWCNLHPNNNNVKIWHCFYFSVFWKVIGRLTISRHDIIRYRCYGKFYDTFPNKLICSSKLLKYNKNKLRGWEIGNKSIQSHKKIVFNKFGKFLQILGLTTTLTLDSAHEKFDVWTALKSNKTINTSLWSVCLQCKHATGQIVVHMHVRSIMRYWRYYSI